MTRHTGRCLCGASSYQFDGPSKFAIRCYCSDCQKVTGGGSAPQLAVAASGFRAEGEVKEYRATGGSGNALVFGFCGSCGSPIYKTTAMAPDLVFVYAGSLDDPSLFVDPRPVFEDSRLPWDVG